MRTHGRNSSWASSSGRAEFCFSAYNWHSLIKFLPIIGSLLLVTMCFILSLFWLLENPESHFEALNCHSTRSNGLHSMVCMLAFPLFLLPYFPLIVSLTNNSLEYLFHSFILRAFYTQHQILIVRSKNRYIDGQT